MRRIAVVESQQLQLDALAWAIHDTPGLSCVAAVLATPTPEPLLDPSIDAILVGIHHAGIDLTAHVRALRAAHRRATIVVLAGYVDATLAAATAAAGADATLPTSTPLQRVLEVLAGAPCPSSLSEDRDQFARDRASSLGLTRRQHEVLRHLADGRSPSQVATHLAITLDTCRDHIRALHRTLGCSSTTEVVVVAARTGLLPALGRPLA